MGGVNNLSNTIVNSLSTLGVWYLILVNAFGVLAIVCKVVEFQCKSRKIIFTLATLSFACWIMYFALQGDFVSALINFICFIEVLLFMKRESWKWVNGIWLMFVFLALQIGLGIITFKYWHDIFAILGGALMTIAYFVMSKKTYRIISAGSQLLWVANSVSKLYVVALINDVFATISVFVSIIRFYVLKKPDGEERENVQNI